MEAAWNTYLDLIPSETDDAALHGIGGPCRGGTPLTYRRLRSFVQTELDLNAYGLGQGDRVCCVLPNGPESAVAFLSMSLQATYAPLNMHLKESEFEFEFIDLPAAAVVIMHGDVSHGAVTVAKRLGLPVLAMVALRDSGVGAPVGLFRLEWLHNPKAPLPKHDPRARRAMREDVALVLHTSGTTNKPKIVPLTHRNIASGRRVVRLQPRSRYHTCAHTRACRRAQNTRHRNNHATSCL